MEIHQNTIEVEAAEPGQMLLVGMSEKRGPVQGRAELMVDERRSHFIACQALLER